MWDGVIIKESMWAYPREHSAKQQMRHCYAGLNSSSASKITEKAREHADRLHEVFSEENQYSLMVSHVCEVLKPHETTTETDVIEFD